MKKFFVEPVSATFLIRDENGLPAGEFAVEKAPRGQKERGKAVLRLVGKPDITFLDLHWLPDVSEHVGLCREMVRMVEPDARLEIEAPPELCHDAYRPSPEATPTIWVRLSKVISAFSRWRQATSDRQAEMSELIEALRTLEQPLDYARDELGRQHWWATCVLCGLPYRHYPVFVPYGSLGRRKEEISLDKNVGLHTNDKLCEECEPKAVRHQMSFGLTDEGSHRVAVVVGGAVHHSNDVEVIALGTPDARTALRRMYSWMLELVKEEA